MRGWIFCQHCWVL